MTILIPIFADQLSLDLPPLSISDKKSAIILIMEVRGEAETVPHHRKKLIFLFSAMRHFAKSLRDQGWLVDYVTLTDGDNTGTFRKEIERAVQRHAPEQIRLCEPSEYRVLEEVLTWEEALGVPVTVMPDTRFIASKSEFAQWAEGRKQYRMEYFYRDMRRKTNLLMLGDDPEGGQWNFDKDNRKSAKADLFMPAPKRFEPDKITQDVIQMVEAEFPTRYGETDEFFYAVTREGALESLSYFIKEALPHFGDYQDAMLTEEPFLYHSLLSLYLNAGLLSPLEICRAVETAYKDGAAPLNAAEGYIRQIIGWREYVRGIYWHFMPEYLDRNALRATRDLPDFYWTGETDMHCLSEATQQTKRYAYAHHIQRLMVTGNFAMLIGVDPKQVHEWYLAVYIDAFEWVELPNTLGMSQFGDGGLLGSKPYASSGAYINRMSNYCGSCKYDVKQRIGPKACPFNSLYWHFIGRNENSLKGNNRMSMIYRNLEKMDAETKADILATADTFLDGLVPAKSEYL